MVALVLKMAASMGSQSLSTTKRYLLWCVNEHVEFRVPELESISSLFGLSIKWIEKPQEKPFLIVDLPSEESLKQLMSRTILVRSAFELWGRGQSYDSVCTAVRKLSPEFLAPYSKPECSFRFRVETFCKSLSRQEKLVKIEGFSFLPFEGPVNLNNPTYSFHLHEYYGLDPNNIPDEPFDVFFSRWVSDGQRNKISHLTLKKRKFIGNTSMDAQLSLIMANQAKVRKGAIVIDPFVGTGSLLVAAAFFGGYVIGNDIDYLTLHGKAKPTRYNQKAREPDENVQSNLRQYSLEHHYIDVLVADTSLPLWRQMPLFDAVIADPPYGIREATERIGTTKQYKIKEEHLQTHIPSKVEYNLTDIYQDLLDFSATYLVLGGRLVFWLPVSRADYSDEKIPLHPCLSLISNCEQILTQHSSRRLITMVKVTEPQADSTSVIPCDIDTFRERYFQSAKEIKMSKKLSNQKSEPG